MKATNFAGLTNLAAMNQKGPHHPLNEPRFSPQLALSSKVELERLAIAKLISRSDFDHFHVVNTSRRA